MSKNEQVFTTFRSTGYSAFCNGSHIAAVDVKDGKILRIRPFRYDWKYSNEHINPWKIEARGKVLEAPTKTSCGPMGITWKKSIYSPNRILYPIKRVDWDPNGERNPQNRGISGYERISWDQALDIIESEIRRIIDTYGPYAIYAQGDGHGETKMVHGPHGCMFKLLDLLGGFTMQIRNADSWEGWFWGTKHFWGGEPFGLMPNCSNLYTDVAKHSELLLYEGCDPCTTTRGFCSRRPGQPLLHVLSRHRHRDHLHLPRPELRRRRVRRQVDPHSAQHRPRHAPGHRLPVADQRYLRQGIPGHPLRGLRQVCRLRPG